MKDSTLQTIFENAHRVDINLNDTFYYVCADMEPIWTDELEDMEEIIDKYDYYALWAYVAIKRGHDPFIQKHAQNPQFIQAKAAIQAIIDSADEYGPFFELRRDLKRAKK